jgi:prepilin-type N-terminal cleavage/methylation domain-containing protein
MKHTRLDKAGFTIMELMIAVTIFSLLLLLSTEVLIGIAKIYDKGVNMSNTQDVARNIIQSLSSSLQYSGQQVEYSNANYFINGQPVNIEAICIGDTRYSYLTGFPGTGTTWRHFLWKDIMANPGTCWPLDIVNDATPSCDNFAADICSNSVAGSGGEMLGSNMHLAYLSVEPATSGSGSQLYKIGVGIAYGLEDLFIANTPNSPPAYNSSIHNYMCNSGSGQQFCTTSNLYTLASERIN